MFVVPQSRCGPPQYSTPPASHTHVPSVRVLVVSQAMLLLSIDSLLQAAALFLCCFLRGLGYVKLLFGMQGIEMELPQPRGYNTLRFKHWRSSIRASIAICFAVWFACNAPSFDCKSEIEASMVHTLQLVPTAGHLG
eukprot:2250615-Amphidinium_carterae.1